MTLNQPDLPLLSFILSAPLAGALLIPLFPARFARHISALSMSASFIYAGLLLLYFDPHATGFQFVERKTWIATLKIDYLVGVDGLSLTFLPFSLLLFMGALLNAWHSALALPRLFHVLLLLQLSLTLAILCALDSLFFFACWEASLLPLYFLIIIWKENPDLLRARQSATHYVLLMLGSGILLLLGLLLAAQANGQTLSFDLTRSSALPPSEQTLIFLLLFAGLAAKLPVVPLHTWLPRLALDSPPGIVASFAAIKLGIYAFIRFVLPLTPDAARELHWLLAGLGTITLLYGAVSALAQSNLRRTLAYVGISHVGLALLGLSAFNQNGLLGASLLLLSFPLSLGALYLLVAFLHRRTGSSHYANLGGIAQNAPRFNGLFLFFTLAACGLPGLNVFPAELLTLVATLTTHTGAALAALFSAVISAAALCIAYRKTFLGMTRAHQETKVNDLLPHELTFILSLAALVLLTGLYPNLLLDLL